MDAFVDPIAADINLYRYCGNDPVIHTDYLGLWTVERSEETQNSERVIACGKRGEMISALARELRLDPKEYRKWLQATGKEELPTSADERLVSSRKFTVPNVIGVYHAKLSATDPSAARTVTLTQSIITMGVYEAEGYKIETVTDGTEVSFKRLFEGENTVGFVFSGHEMTNFDKLWGLRLDSSWSNWWNGGVLVVAQPQEFTRPFGLAYLDLYACRSAEPVLGMYWSAHVSPRGEFIGAVGDIGIAPWDTHEWTTWHGPTPPAYVVRQVNSR